nr:DUF664 domain-containing protein [Acidobacteriota bacterium]
LELLGDAERFTVQGNLVSALREAIAGLSEEQLRVPETRGKWSILQVIEHLMDAELIHNYRVRMILAHDEPQLLGWDQDAFVERLRYDQTDVAQALSELEMLRDRNLRLLRMLSPEERARAGIHSVRGRESIDEIIKLTAGHDLVHRRQVDRIRKKVAG